MKTCVEFVDGSGGATRLRELWNLFASLREGQGGNAVAHGVIPRWLRDAFARERTADEAEAWLAQWRVAPDKHAFEQASGWTEANWLYWFSSDNEFWSLEDALLDNEERSLTLLLRHNDDPIPIEAIKWLQSISDLDVVRVYRLE